MKHVLDNPVWSALTSGNENLSFGNETIRYFSPEVSPFVGMVENNRDNFEILHQTISLTTPVGVFTSEKLLNPSPWKILQRIDGYQMIFPKALKPDAAGLKLTPLNTWHVPEMLALTQLTNPGPFSSKTISFGNYKGIFVNDKLVAMAGHRLHAGSNTEISAVCTHPDYIGKGYARQLILSQILDIQSQNEMAYLHVRADNTRAIQVYQSMGFEIRSEMIIYILKKN